MAWLTVNEAAEWLGISEAAVRKRIQRDTLEHSKWPNGRVYVYVDVEQNDEKDVEHDDEKDIEQNDEKNEPPGNSDKDNNANNQHSWWDYAAGVSGLAVLFGALIYALGLVVVFAPLLRTETHDVSTAWHATFLVPRSTVAGLGVRQLVAFPLAAGALMLAWALLWGKLTESRIRWLRTFVGGPMIIAIVLYASWYLSTVPGPISKAPYTSLVLFVTTSTAAISFSVAGLGLLIYRDYRLGLLIGVFGPVSAILSFLSWRYSIAPKVESLQQLSGIIGSLLDIAIVVAASSIVYLGATLAAVLLDYEEADLNSQYDKWKIRLRAFIMLLACAFAGAFLLTVPSSPPLLSAQINTKDGEDVTGRLLVHTEGFWYIFKTQKDKSKSTLRAIPDDKVKTVLMPPSEKAS